MKNLNQKAVACILLLLPIHYLFSQEVQPASAIQRHGDIVYKIEIPYVEPVAKGVESIWHFPEIRDNGLEYLQLIISSIDTLTVYEKGKKHVYYAHKEIIQEQAKIGSHIYNIYSQMRPYLDIPYQYGDSVSGYSIGNDRDGKGGYPVHGFGYSAVEGIGLLTDGENVIKDVALIHNSNDITYIYEGGATERYKEDRYLWYGSGSSYAFMETLNTSKYEKDELIPVKRVTYLYLPYMQLDLADDAANNQLIAELAAADAAREAISRGQGVGAITAIDAKLSPDGQTVTIQYQLGSDSDISFYACDITGSMLGSVMYQKREAGEWQEALVLDRRPIGNTLILAVRCGKEQFSLKVSKK